MPQSHILVVEDEPVTRALFTLYLERADYRVTAVDSGAGLRAALPADLVLLDLGLPDEDGLLLARELRARSTVPILVVTHRGEANERVLGLELGADDYLVKPPEMRELLLRVRNLLKRAQGTAQRFGGWRLDRTRNALLDPKGDSIALTLGELNVLGALLDARGATVARAALVEALGAEDRSRSLDVIVNRLRRKLGEGGSVFPRLILTVHGVGYRIGVPVE